MKHVSLWEGHRMRMDEAMELTFTSLRNHGAHHDHWAMAWSGGKDSTAMLTLLLYGVNSGQEPAPKKVSVGYADTRQEMPPLYAAAAGRMDLLRTRGVDVRVCTAPMKRELYTKLHAGPFELAGQVLKCISLHPLDRRRYRGF